MIGLKDNSNLYEIFRDKENKKGDKKMKEKTITYKLSEKGLAKLNYYRGRRAISQSEFSAIATEEKCNNDRLLRSGGMILKVPNPNFYNLSEEQRIKIIKVLATCVGELNNITPYTDMGLSEILYYARTRFLKDDYIKKNNIKRNRDEDIEFEERN